MIYNYTGGSTKIAMEQKESRVRIQPDKMCQILSAGEKFFTSKTIRGS
jgi:hypothetical protein